MIRYIRAFWLALKLTLRGEQPQESFQPLRAWIVETATALDVVYETADTHYMNQEAREAIVLKLDGRDMSMQTILDAIRHHTGEEYPYMLNNLTEHSITAIYASNMNDQYYVMRLHDDPTIAANPAVQSAVKSLSEQLEAIPPSNELVNN